MTAAGQVLARAAAAGVVALALMIGLPALLPFYALIQLTNALALAVLALSLALVWGIAGILCFGQAAFFGLGAYAYAVAAINFGDTTLAVPLALLVPAAFAAALGWFMFYGRLGDVYLGVVTLTVSLILFKLMNGTSGPEYRIGVARLGGLNGIPSTPPLNAPFAPDVPLFPETLFMVAVAALAVAYVGCVWLVRSRFGRVVAAVRENPTRAELLGYDVRRYRLIVFTAGAAVAGLAGMLFAQNVLVTPALFGLSYSAQAIVWAIVGGLGTLVGPILAAIGLQYLTDWLGAAGWLPPDLALGAVLMLFVVLVPRGVWPLVLGAVRRRAGEGR